MSDAYPSLGIKVDFAEIRRLIGGLKEVQAEYVKTGQAAQAARAKVVSTTQSSAATAAAKATVTDLMNLKTAAAGVSGVFSGLFGVLHRVRMAGFAGWLAIGLLVGAMAAGPVLRMADAMTALEARTRLYAASGAQVPSIMVRLFQTAQDARAPLEGIAKLYTRLAPLSEQLGRSQGDLIRIVETVAKAFTLGGASAAEATSSAQQFAQAISSNRFGGDELRSVAENAPALLQAIAEGVNQINPALNLNAATFIKWAQAGNATSEVMVKALENSRAKIEAMFASMPVTVDQSMTMLKNSITNAIGEIDKAFAAQNGGVKLSTEIALTISKIAAGISDPKFIQEAAAALKVLGDSLQFLGSAAVIAAKGAAILAAGFVSLKVAGTVAAVVDALAFSVSVYGIKQTIATNATLAMTGATGGLRTALLALQAATPLIFFAVLASAIWSATDTLKAGEDAVKSYTGAVTGGAQAITNAITVAQAYGQNVTGLTADLHQMAGAQQESNEKVDQGTQLARDMAEVQRQMAIAQLEATSATFQSIAADTAKAASMKRLFATIIEGVAQVAKIPAPFLNLLGSGSFGGGDVGSNIVTRLQGIAGDLRGDADALDGASNRAAQNFVTAQTAISRLRSMTFKPLSADSGGGGAGGGAAPGAAGKGESAADARQREREQEEAAERLAKKLIQVGEAAKNSKGALYQYRLERDRALSLASMSSAEAEKESRALELAVIRQRELNDLTYEQTLAWARTVVEIEIAEDRAASLKGTMKDSIERAFIESGKLDFSSIKEGLTKSIRQAVYDALIARPIQIIVDAVVKLTTDTMVAQIRELLAKFTGSRDENGNANNVMTQMKDVMAKLPSGVQKALEKGMTLAKDAVAGYQLGTTVANMVGLKGSNKNGGKDQQTADMAASAVGAFFGGPLGSAIAVGFTRLLGPALLGKESDHTASAIFSQNSTSFSLVGGKRTAETSGAATGIAESVMGLIQTLTTMGIDASNVIKSIGIGTRDQSTIITNSGAKIRSAMGDPEAALKAASLALLQYGTYQDARMKALVDQMVAANSNFDAIVAKLDQYVMAQKVPKDLQTALLQYSNPRAAQLSQLQDQQVERRKTIQGYAASGFYTPSQLSQINSNLTALERNEIASVVERFADSLDGAAHSLKDFKAAQEDIAKFTRRLMTGSLSPLSQEDQLSLNRQSYITNLARASGGDYGALTGITDDAQAYLTAAQKFFGSTQAYTDIFKEVTDALNVLSSQEIQDPMVSAIEQAAADLTAALEAQTLALIAAIQSANNNTVDGLNGLGEAVVTTNGGGLANIADSMVGRNLYGAALAGGIAA